ncbi:MAG: TonB-dependent receptor plug domain-containing protein [bacterium]
MKPIRIAIAIVMITLLCCFVCLPIVNAQEGIGMGDVDPVLEEENEGGIKKITLPEVVVTATRMETPAREIASSYSVVSGEDMDTAQSRAVIEALRDIPGLDPVQVGGLGGNSNIKIRGAETRHTLVLIDGVEVNDPISIDRSSNFSGLLIDNIDRIEVLRGPQSALYGSDAIGGVINIITQKGEGDPKVSLSNEMGSFDSYRGALRISRGTDLMNYSIGLSRYYTDGISAAAKEYGNTERDGYENTTASARLGLTPTQEFGVDLMVRHIDAEGDMDNSGGTDGDDINYVFTTHQSFLKIEPRLSLFDMRWNQKLGFSYAKHQRHYSNGTDPNHPADLSQNSYESDMVSFNWQHDIEIHPSHTLTIGLLEYEEERGQYQEYSESIWGPYADSKDDLTARTVGCFLQDHITLDDRFVATLGVRVDDYKSFGTEETYRIASAYRVNTMGTRLKASYGTGFKAPSLYQLYSPLYGSPALEPEKSYGWDCGIEQGVWNDKVVTGITFFRNRFREMITFDWDTWKYENIQKARSQGIECMLSARPADDLTLKGSYTYTDTEDLSTGESFLHRARNRFSLGADYALAEKGTAHLEVRYVGRRYDNDYSTSPATRIILREYVLVNLSASYSVTESFQVFGRVDNLLDERYEEVKGYGTPGINGFAGFRFLL